MSRFLGVGGHQWLLLLAAVQAVLLIPDAFIGHYRSGFALRAQYAPFFIAALLAVSAVAAAIGPGVGWVSGVAIIAGALGIAGGVGGLWYHHWYGITTKPGGYRWLLHHLMHHAPPLAPLGLCIAGTLEVIGAWGAAGHSQLSGVSLRILTLGVVSVALGAMALQAALLHYRGAYNNPAMYVPLIVLPLAAGAAIWHAAEPASSGPRLVATALLGATCLAGFVGAGMHLRGMDRQMGGLYMGVAAILEAPPPGAPLLVAALGASGLVAIRLL